MNRTVVSIVVCLGLCIPLLVDADGKGFSPGMLALPIASCPPNHRKEDHYCFSTALTPPTLQCPEGTFLTGKETCIEYQSQEAHLTCPPHFDLQDDLCISHDEETPTPHCPPSYQFLRKAGLCEREDLSSSIPECPPKTERKFLKGVLHCRSSFTVPLEPQCRDPTFTLTPEGECIWEEVFAPRQACPEGYSMNENRLCVTPDCLKSFSPEKCEAQEPFLDCDASEDNVFLDGNECVRERWERADMVCPKDTTKNKEGLCQGEQLDPPMSVCPPKKELVFGGRFCLSRVQTLPTLGCSDGFVFETEENKKGQEENICRRTRVIEAQKECDAPRESAKREVLNTSITLIDSACYYRLEFESFSGCLKGRSTVAKGGEIMCESETRTNVTYSCIVDDYIYDPKEQLCYPSNKKQ